MTRLPIFFLTTAAIFAVLGMLWGIQMSASHDHTLSPAHGHLNLIGFVALAVFGFYYALTPEAARSGLAKLHYGLSVATVLVLVPGIVLAITERGETLAQIGSLLAVLTMVLFVFILLRHGFGAIDADNRRPVAGNPNPAE
ncbi:hypothetical protein [Ruegeria arenilitoris]|uniref:hypothetical protein n=1 Tax=Ruegeria arenilitoris TaxID=1173585 RepID=UPI001479909F|nr:hypothetical protein [Ruegeria arenilitoris]